MQSLMPGFVQTFFCKMVQAEIGVHFTMDKVLIGCTKLAGKQTVENLNNFLVAFPIGFLISE